LDGSAYFPAISSGDRPSVVVVVLVVGPISTAAMRAYCTLTAMEFRHSSPEALHTKRRERPLLAKDGTKAKEIYLSIRNSLNY
jgi:hypothetical protein